MLGRITLLLISSIALSGLSSQCQAQCPGEVPLAAFTGVVFIKAQLRFEVTSIKAGTKSVGHLFRDPNTTKTNWWDGGYFRQVPRPLMIKRGADLDELRNTLIEENVDELQVSLEDQYLSGWSTVPGLRSAIYKSGCAIKVDLAACDERTKLIYDEVSSITREEWHMEGETTARLEVSEAFYKLLSDKLKDYMKSLPSPEEGPCIGEIRLTKFLEAKGTAGFGSRGYQLNEEIKSFLDVMTVAMRDAAKEWSPYQLDVKFIGFGDHNKVGEKIDLLTSDTGIDEAVWRDTPLEVYQDGCNNDWVKDRVYFDFSSHPQSKPIGDIHNNCELGAVRAFIAAAYLRSRLGTDRVSYSYATGGTLRKSGRIEPADRRINVEFIMKGARKIK